MKPDEFIELNRKAEELIKRKERKKGELNNLRKQLESFNCKDMEDIQDELKRIQVKIDKLKEEVQEDIETFNKLYGKLLDYIEKRN